jgi:cytochrome c6
MQINSILIFIALCLYSCVDSSKELSGQEIYKTRCVACHGADGRMGMSGAKDLTSSPLTLKQRISVVTDGRKIMPSFKAVMSTEQIKAVVEYTMTLK